MKSPSDRIADLTDLHITVLSLLLQGLSFEEITDELSVQMKQMHYLDRAKDSGCLDFADGQLVGAYPISPIPTKFWVHVKDIGVGYAMCAIDALGVAYTFDQATTIVSSFADTGQRFRLVVDPSSDEIYFEGYVSYLPMSQSCNAALEQCPTIDFYEDPNRIPYRKRVMVMDKERALIHAKSRFSPSYFEQVLTSGK